jgi:hypothetical protein
MQVDMKVQHHAILEMVNVVQNFVPVLQQVLQI